jgi:predicted permease
VRIFAAVRSWWRALIHRGRVNRDVEEELRFHIEQRTQHLVDTGMPPSDARRQAKLEMGQPELQGESYRTAIGLRPFYELGGDLRLAIRSLYRYPLVSAAAIVSLAMGIGATSAMFNVIDSAVLNPFPYRDTDRIVNPSLIDEKQPLLPTWFALEPAQYTEFLKASSIESVLGFLLRGQLETGGEYPEDARSTFVTVNMNAFLGVQPLLGRGFQASDDGQNVVLLGYKYWQRRFGGSPSVVGQTLELDHQPLTIVGVMPQRFTFTETVGNADCYIPWAAARVPALLPWIKLKPGVSPAVADAEFQSYVEHFQKQTPMHFPKKFRVNVQPIAAPYLHRNGRSLALLFVSVLLLLAIGCVNCSVLLLARGEARQHELSIRSAIGAGRFRLVRQLLVEAVTIASVGAVLGIFFSLWLAKLPLKLMPNLFPQEAVITMNWHVLAFSMGMALLTGILFGLAPALRFSRPDIAQMMQARTRTITRSGGGMLNVLVGAQIMLTCVLLSVAVTAYAGFRHITSINLGYDPHHVGFIGLALKPDPDKNQPAYARHIEELSDTIASVPGVISVGILNSGIPPSQPFGGLGLPASFEILGRKTGEPIQALVQLVSPDYFATMKIALLKGRLWSRDEGRRGDFVAAVNQTFVDRYMAGRDVLGQQVRTDALKNDGRPASITSPESDEWRQIVGVVADSRNDGLERPTAPAVYVPYTAFMWNSAQVFFRSRVAPESLEQPIRAALHKLDPEQRIGGNEIGTLDKALSVQTIWVQQHMFSVLFLFFGSVALALSLFGIASIVLFTAGRRRNELGIRMALGATRVHIVWTVMRTLLATIAAGVVLGLSCSFAMRTLLRHWMPAGQQSAWNSIVMTLMLLLIAATACLVPAMRAAYANPLDTLRND